MRRISIIGLGKIGQAIAANILKQNIQVTAIDTNPGLQTIFKNEKYESKEPGLGDILTLAYRESRLVITEDFSSVKGSDAIIVAIPLLIDNQKKTLDAPFLAGIKKWPLTWKAKH